MTTCVGVLVLIGPAGDRLFARVDDRRFPQEYGYGPGKVNLGAEYLTRSEA